MHVLGTSAYVPDLLMRAPEVIRLYADGPNGSKLLRRRPRRRRRGRWWPRPRGTPTRCGRSPRRARCGASELARIASADLLGMLEVTEVCRR